MYILYDSKDIPIRKKESPQNIPVSDPGGYADCFVSFMLLNDTCAHHLILYLPVRGCFQAA